MFRVADLLTRNRISSNLRQFFFVLKNCAFSQCQQMSSKLLSRQTTQLLSMSLIFKSSKKIPPNITAFDTMFVKIEFGIYKGMHVYIYLIRHYCMGASAKQQW